MGGLKRVEGWLILLMRISRDVFIEEMLHPARDSNAAALRTLFERTP